MIDAQQEQQQEDGFTQQEMTIPGSHSVKQVTGTVKQGLASVQGKDDEDTWYNLYHARSGRTIVDTLWHVDTEEQAKEWINAILDSLSVNWEQSQADILAQVPNGTIVQEEIQKLCIQVGGRNDWDEHEEVFSFTLRGNITVLGMDNTERYSRAKELLQSLTISDDWAVDFNPSFVDLYEEK